MITKEMLDKNNVHIDVKSIRKRSGAVEPFSMEKLVQLIERTTAWEPNPAIRDYLGIAILKSINTSLYESITSTELFNLLIRTAVNLITAIYPQFEMVAARLYLLKIYSETYHMKTDNDFPHLKKVIKNGLVNNVYSPELYAKYTDEEIDTLNSYINRDYDFLFTYKALYGFYDKYCLFYHDKQTGARVHIELPQHAYMRVAMFLMQDEPVKDRLNLIKACYLALAKHDFTYATPIMLNAGTRNPQCSSCVLSQIPDDTAGIMHGLSNLALYSKFKGGTAADFGLIRASGSNVYGNNGKSSGPVPFIKILEAIMKGFNQGGVRPGACCVYFNWWHWNVREMVVLKNNNGTEENRARQLKYAVKINQLFLDRVLKDEDVCLFNPQETPELSWLIGKDFEDKYLEYEQNPAIHKTRLNARELFTLILKERAETGNIYLFHIENVNNASLLNRYINSSNLCTEITLPSRASVLDSLTLSNDVYKNNKLVTKGKITTVLDAGEIALCNLASVNLVNWSAMNEQDQQKLIDIMVRGLDNTVDLALYPVKEAEYSNSNYRFLGIGVSNYANLLARAKVIIDEPEARELTAKVFDDLSYQIIKASVYLAKLKGKFPRFKETQWANGTLPIDKANKLALRLTHYQPNMDRWNELRAKIKKHGIRNATLMAIAPTATSGKAINATESIEPVQFNGEYKEDGIITIKTLTPDLRQNRAYYKKGVDCNQFALVELAAIRQCYLDQAQSVNVYFKKITSTKDFMMLHLYGFALGMKTFYYCKTEKEVVGEICESCS